MFHQLLTSNEWFVYHDRDNESGVEILRQWREVWEKLEGTNWRQEAEAVLEEHAERVNGNA